MQVQTTNTVDYTTATKDTTQTNKAETTSNVKFDMSKPFDIDSFTFEDYKAINYDDLEEWIKSSKLPNEKDVLAKTNILASMTIMTDDDTFNKVLFDKTNESYNQTGKSLFLSVFVPLADMRSGGRLVQEEHSRLTDPAVEESFKNDPNNWSTSLTGGRRTASYFFEIDSMLSDMKKFPDFYNNLDTEYKKLMGDVRDTYQAFDEIIAEYTKRKNEANATLDAYTRNTKQNPVSEKI